MEKMSLKDREVLQATHKMVSDLHLKIAGNEDLKIKGMAQDVLDHECKIASLEKSRSRQKWLLGGIGVGSTLVSTFLGGSKWVAAIVKFISVIF